MGYIVRKVPADANNITTGIINYINSKGGKASRINTTGIYDEIRDEWRTSNATKGVSDIVACVKGRFIGIEVKYGSDSQKIDQKKWQKHIEAAGGIYIIARKYGEFIKWFDYYLTKIDVDGTQQ